ncbi:uncharacterized protein BT62DRAFT_990353 [Guyanagaster necrorhizus]|uniref:Ubiquitin 3 binding protein But2 C-terminal domain-containing protein n=1 Tax=Guyanagaster necrorhizus TaxID=856835 RepID=A0A9P8AXP1_9AGAR|nr:uncharacterized protein BT62DRAFT_990353 [Guyanagaster necrorhizus MCA 3950]KAG7451999.1 hypothetical protein BT62DRAFT_990353 [Guyanagaster necrorhizus MCA 3950]
MPGSHEGYAVLSSHDPSASSDDQEKSSDQPGLKNIEVLACRFIVLASVVAVLSGVCNFAILWIYNTRGFTPVPRLLYDLPRPNPYIGLERATLNPLSPEPQPIMNFPILAAQVNSAEVDKVYFDVPSLKTPYGTVYPRETNFTVSSELSMILQFRVMDFGMERCTLMGSLPSAADLERSEKSVPVVSSDAVKLEAWFLDDNDVQLNAETLSYSNRPRRTTLAGVWGVTMDKKVQISDAFECPSRSLLTFELVCTNPKCYLHFKQDEDEPIMAAFISQASSIRKVDMGT